MTEKVPKTTEFDLKTTELDLKTAELDLVKLSAKADAGRRSACFIVIAGSEVGRVFVISEREMSIGRSHENAICLVDDGISRRHAVVRHLGDDEFVIEDAESTNGTFCNGTRVKTVRLNDGDKVMMGSTAILKFSYNDAVEKSFRENLFESSVRDWLTKCYNKRYFVDHLHVEFAHAKRQRQLLSLLLFDIDHFKRVNDTFGHAVGDIALQHVASILTEAVPEGAVLCRYGGEEFIAILPRMSNDAAYALAEHIRTLLQSNTMLHEGAALPLTVSVGVATMQGASCVNEDAFVRMADERLYRAKDRGRNRTER